MTIKTGLPRVTYPRSPGKRAAIRATLQAGFKKLGRLVAAGLALGAVVAGRPAHAAGASSAGSRAKQAATMSQRELGMLVPRGFTTWDAWDARHEPMPCGSSHSSPEDLSNCQRAAFEQGLLVKPTPAQRRELERFAPAPRAVHHPPHQQPSQQVYVAPGPVPPPLTASPRTPYMGSFTSGPYKGYVRTWW
jgi:hypothetical protein